MIFSSASIPGVAARRAVPNSRILDLLLFKFAALLPKIPGTIPPRVMTREFANCLPNVPIDELFDARDGQKER